jgi:hypothetical protein
VLLELSQCSLDGDATRQRWLSSLLTMGLTFFYFFYSLSTPKNYRLALFVVGILTSVLILLITLYFFSSSFLYTKKKKLKNNK